MQSKELGRYIRSIELDRDKVPSFSQYPFNLPVLRDLDTLSLHPKVTFLVGENGSGKSTVLEAIAVACGFNAEGGTKNFNFSSRATHSDLANYVKVVKGVRKPRTGFFFRAESFYNLASNIDDLDTEIAFGPRIIDSYGGLSLHKQSHGESFFAVFLNRFSGEGIYILDEPESALSPSRQMSMLTRMHELVKEGSQFIIATHSPIIMAYPDAVLYEITDKIDQVSYEETEHYQIMRTFLNKPQKMLKLLLDETY
ncbi:putative ATPase [Desulfitobacterium dichloroeliminans LMG P-21439]|uniref:Putative ATPase n=1 Tax=Desulfitobacterium dichloroeliminans (strain LMG P-21439 / DCA1) TaxID=871963 RepID=L0F241_DESDL|nr:AAA family ATPase [Desulfitobacterium dichloroeliminans]AGA67919.1 putative ATPase [Desulfitobacterium dichloroeliminans LMG P-21439]